MKTHAEPADLASAVTTIASIGLRVAQPLLPPAAGLLRTLAGPRYCHQNPWAPKWTQPPVQKAL